MQWQGVRNLFPHHWVVFEAVQAHTESNYRMVDDIQVADAYDDFWDAWHHYEELHALYPQREYMVYHTSNADLVVTISQVMGLRARLNG